MAGTVLLNPMCFYPGKEELQGDAIRVTRHQLAQVNGGVVKEEMENEFMRVFVERLDEIIARSIWSKGNK